MRASNPSPAHKKGGGRRPSPACDGPPLCACLARMTRPRNLITDVAGLRVGNAQDAALARRRHGRALRRAGRRLLRGARRRARHPRDRPAGARQIGARHRRDRPLRRLGLRARRGERRPGLAARAGHRLCRSARCGCRSCRRRSCSTSSTAATRTGAATRPIASSATRPPRAAGLDFALGTAGGGYGATTATSRAASARRAPSTSSGPHGRGARRRQRHRVGGHRRRPAFLGRARSRKDDEFGGLGHPARVDPGDAPPRLEGRPASPSTTIALVATDAVLTKAQAKRLAVAAHAGIARGLRFAHALYDGDTVFAAATGRSRSETGRDSPRSPPLRPTASPGRRPRRLRGDRPALRPPNRPGATGSSRARGRDQGQRVHAIVGFSRNAKPSRCSWRTLCTRPRLVSSAPSQQMKS